MTTELTVKIEWHQLCITNNFTSERNQSQAESEVAHCASCLVMLRPLNSITNENKKLKYQ